MESMPQVDAPLARIMVPMLVELLPPLNALAQPTPTESIPVSDVSRAQKTPLLLVMFLALPKLLAIARKTFMEMLKLVHALLAITAVPLTLRQQQLLLSQLTANAPPTPTEMVPSVRTALRTQRHLLTMLPKSLHKLLAYVRPTTTVMPELVHALLVLTA